MPDLVDTPLAVPAKLNERIAVLVAWIVRIAHVIAATHVFGPRVGGGKASKNPFMFGPPVDLSECITAGVDLTLSE
jgi:hypothetical protein